MASTTQNNLEIPVNSIYAHHDKNNKIIVSATILSTNRFNRCVLLMAEPGNKNSFHNCVCHLGPSWPIYWDVQILFKKELPDPGPRHIWRVSLGFPAALLSILASLVSCSVDSLMRSIMQPFDPEPRTQAHRGPS